MNRTPKCLLKIKQSLPALSGKYLDIANYILDNPGRLARARGREIAEACACDDSLIIRFCQKLGFNGFSDLKESLASEFMPVDTSPASFEPKTGFEKFKAEFLDLNCRALRDTAALAVETEFSKASETLKSSKRIFIFGVGASGVVAIDAQLKLLRLGYDVVQQQDSASMRLLSGLATKSDVLLAISFTGGTAEVCETAERFKERGGKVVAVTNFPDSRLAKCADAVLATAADENVFRIAAMSSRLAQMFVIDMLILSLAMREMENAREEKGLE
jgi:DNA-binding MurR/RpiR family transcriptional regulator